MENQIQVEIFVFIKCKYSLYFCFSVIFDENAYEPKATNSFNSFIKAAETTLINLTDSNNLNNNDNTKIEFKAANSLNNFVKTVETTLINLTESNNVNTDIELMASNDNKCKETDFIDKKAQLLEVMNKNVSGIFWKKK